MKSKKNDMVRASYHLEAEVDVHGIKEDKLEIQSTKGNSKFIFQFLMDLFRIDSIHIFKISDVFISPSTFTVISFLYKRVIILHCRTI